MVQHPKSGKQSNRRRAQRNEWGDGKRQTCSGEQVLHSSLDLVPKSFLSWLMSRELMSFLRPSPCPWLRTCRQTRLIKTKAQLQLCYEAVLKSGSRKFFTWAKALRKLYSTASCRNTNASAYFRVCVFVFDGVEPVSINPCTPKGDQCQISPAASPEISHHTVWRTWLFIAYSDERWLYCQFSRPRLYISL